MKVFKRAVSLLAVALLLSAVCLPLAGCGERSDVIIRLKSTTRAWPPYAEPSSRTWIFPVGTDEIHDEIEYTGQEIRIFVDACCLQGKSTWLYPESPNYSFPNSCFFTDENGEKSEVSVILERGVYEFICEAKAASNLWKARTIRLYITVV